MNGFRDIELLSAYLDGQLAPSDLASLESRIALDPELDSALSDLRAARDILQKLPSRKAPRNFMLTRKMVGARPPLPRTYSFFRFSSAFATVLLAITFAFNFLGSGISFGAGAPAPAMESDASPGVGADCDEGCAESPSFQMPLAGAAATEAAAEAPLTELAALPTVIASAPADSARLEDTLASEPTLPKESGAAPAEQAEGRRGAGFFLSIWQIVLLIVALVGALSASLVGRSAKRKWS